MGDGESSHSAHRALERGAIIERGKRVEVAPTMGGGDLFVNRERERETAAAAVGRAGARGSGGEEVGAAALQREERVRARPRVYVYTHIHTSVWLCVYA